MFYLILRKTLPIQTLSDEKVLSYTSHFLVWKTNSLNLSYYFCSLHANFLPWVPWVSCLLALSLALSPASWLCLYLLSVARSLKNSERKKTKMFDIYHTELCIVFALDLCNCANLSSSYPILWYTLAVLMIFFILITYLLTMYWLCKEKLNWFTLWAVIEKLPFVCNILNKCVVHNILSLLPLCCNLKTKLQVSGDKMFTKKICTSQNIRRYCNKF